MALLNMFTKKYHRSIINSIEVSLKCGIELIVSTEIRKNHGNYR